MNIVAATTGCTKGSDTDRWSCEGDSCYPSAGMGHNSGQVTVVVVPSGGVNPPLE